MVDPTVQRRPTAPAAQADPTDRAMRNLRPHQTTAARTSAVKLSSFTTAPGSPAFLACVTTTTEIKWWPRPTAPRPVDPAPTINVDERSAAGQPDRRRERLKMSSLGWRCGPRHLRSTHPRWRRSLEDIPDDWNPSTLPFGHTEVVAAVRELAPQADLTDPEWIHIVLPGADIEVNVARAAPLDSFALHVRAADNATADRFIASLLERLGARAFAPGSETGIFQA
jgi:hypothetical protein